MDLINTHQLRSGDVVDVCGALLKVGMRSVSHDANHFERHTFNTTVVDYGEWPHAKRDLKDYEVSGTHLDLWRRVRR